MCVDQKVTRRFYPRTNNERVLELFIEGDPHLFMRKNKIAIHGTIKVHEDFVPDVGFAAKLFSRLTVEVDGQAVTPTHSR